MALELLSLKAITDKQEFKQSKKSDFSTLLGHRGLEASDRLYVIFMLCCLFDRQQVIGNDFQIWDKHLF